MAGFCGRGFGGGGGDKIAPVSAGDELDVTVDAVGAKGDGIAKKEGFVIFVPGAAKGDTVKIKITKVLSNMAFAEVIGKGEGKKKAERDEASELAGEMVQEEQQPVDTEDFGEEK